MVIDERVEKLLEHLWQTVGIPATSLTETSFKMIARRILDESRVAYRLLAAAEGQALDA